MSINLRLPRSDDVRELEGWRRRLAVVRDHAKLANLPWSKAGHTIDKDIDFAGQGGVNLRDPVGGSDIANKNYVDLHASIKNGSYIWPDEVTANVYYADHPELVFEGAERKIALQISEFNASYIAIGVP